MGSKQNQRSETPLIFHIVRHSQVEDPSLKTTVGQRDISLNETGKIEAAHLAEKFKDISFQACYSADVLRSLETSSIILGERKLAIQKDERLHKRDYGSWEGQPKLVFQQANPEEKLDVEANASICQRIFDFLNEKTAEYSEGNLLIITHVSVMKNILMTLNNLNYRDMNDKTDAYIELVYLKGNWSVNSHNLT